MEHRPWILVLAVAAGCKLGELVVQPPVARLAFATQPSGAEAGVEIAPPVQVAALDDVGDTVRGFTGRITIALGANAANAILTGPRSVAAVRGVATFPSLEIDRPGAGFTLSAGADGLSPATSGPFDVVRQPSTVVFSVQPEDARAGAAITPPVEVTALDAQGNVATDYTGPVTIGLAPNVLSAELSGTLMVNAVNGVARFADLHVDVPGVDYYLVVALRGGSPSATSAAFTVFP